MDPSRKKSDTGRWSPSASAEWSVAASLPSWDFPYRLPTVPHQLHHLAGGNFFLGYRHHSQLDFSPLTALHHARIIDYADLHTKTYENANIEKIKINSGD